MTKHIYKLFFLCLLVFAACKKNDVPVQQVSDADGTYFSIKQFIKDQWDTYHGQPFMLVKTVKFNGKVDSTMIGAYDINWADIFDVFFQSDIGEKKYLGLYDFSEFEDGTTQTRNFFYEAKDKKLYTRKLQISADSYNNKIRSIFIETQKNDESGTRTQKLFYRPIRSIIIQEYAAGISGPKKDLVIEYRFM